MTGTELSTFRIAAPAIANHLWQSTAFVLAVSLLTLLLSKNQARIRYGLWLAASAKFLIPFSALMAFSSVIPLTNHAVPAAQPSLISALSAIDQPFSAGTVKQNVNHQSFLQPVEVWLPAALTVVWALGCAAVLMTWYARWMQVSTMLEKAVPAEDRREVEILRRIENDTMTRTRTRFLISSDLIEPGVCGIFRPVLLWPAQLSDRLEDEHLESIMAHEVAHVQCRDNLTAWIHMVVEAIFWFHPFVWWIERKMIEERERACDEAVLHAGSRAETYADSLLRVSRFCAELSMPCVSGITGADLSKRIRSIMACRVIDLGIGKRLILSAFAVAAVAGPVAFGVMQNTTPTRQILRANGPLPSFEVASIRPDHSPGPTTIGSAGFAAPKDRFIANNITIKKLLCWAFGGDSLPFPNDQVSGGPAWINSDRYDINAKLEDSQVAKLAKLSSLDTTLQVRLMVQSLLANRFGLVLKDTMVIRPVYALTIAKGGLKLQEPDPSSKSSPNKLRGGTVQWSAEPGEIGARSVPISFLVRTLSQSELGRPVVDQTGLKGNYSFDLTWTPGINSRGTIQEASPGAESTTDGASGPSIFTAIREQLGLKLEPTKAPVEAIEIVRIEKPSEN